MRVSFAGMLGAIFDETNDGRDRYNFAHFFTNNHRLKSPRRVPCSFGTENQRDREIAVVGRAPEKRPLTGITRAGMIAPPRCDVRGVQRCPVGGVVARQPRPAKIGLPSRMRHALRGAGGGRRRIALAKRVAMPDAGGSQEQAKHTSRTRAMPA